MGGFKSGAADDDWGETSAETDAADVDESTPDPAVSGDAAASEVTESSSPVASSTAETESSVLHRDLPWVLTRNSITDGRDQTVQLHLQSSTIDAQRQGKRDVEAVLGESVKKADLREAALLVGLQDVDAVADLLRDWGYDVK